MAATRITPITAPGPYINEEATPQLATVTPVAADATDGNVVSLARGILLRAENTGGSPRTITIKSQPDPYGRVADITAFSIAAGARVVRRFANVGWANTGGDLEIEASHADVRLEVYQL
jgi:hypothetical protein